jgi:glycosyltransferase involved in cell wall biosynthesis
MKLSIIIPTVGRTTLPKVLEGIENTDQYAEINPEVIVVFDGDQQINEIEESHCKIYKSPRSGVSAARNYGIEKSTGEIIIFIGDDTIPISSWLQKIYDFHTKNPSQKAVLLGKISWTPILASDLFHQWLENYAQFQFDRIKKNNADWRHFYTSNISLKRSFLISDSFNERFQGWGFEDSELGYRLFKRGMKMTYDETCEVLHDHRQTLATVLINTRNARKNAKRFESIHPEIQILPRGFKKIMLNILILFSYLFRSPQVIWWREWKKAWIEKK